ncbi:MAG: enolase C-terminal domain-like protein, partial [Chloroflexota bacterium]
MESSHAPAIQEEFRVDRVRIFLAAIPLEVPFTISGGTLAVRKSLIVELAGDGIGGFGESAPFEAPFYSAETTDSALAMLTRWLAPRVVGRSFSDIAHLNEVLGEGIRGNHFARAGIETAAWDLVARRNGISLQELIRHQLGKLGVPAEYRESRPYFESGVALGIPPGQDLALLCAWAEQSLKDGYHRVKIKVKPGWDAVPTRAVREVIGADFPFWVDANAAYRLEEHYPTLKALDEYELLFVEQPLHHDDLIDHAELARRLTTPICIDESLKDARAGRQALAVGAASVWNIKIQRVGGLYEACRLYKLGVENGVRIWGGT